jgi:hypothetical protein
MSAAARDAALDRNWSTVFEKVYAGYRQILPNRAPSTSAPNKTFRTIPVS